MKTFPILLAFLVAGCSGLPARKTTWWRDKPPTELEIAIEALSYARVEQLTQGGARVNEPSRLEPPIVFAVQTGQFDVAELLAARGAVLKPVGDGPGPLEAASQAGNLPMMRMLLKRGASTKRVGFARSALHLAAEAGHLEAVKLLLDTGADINVVGPGSGETPLLLATEQGHLEIVKELLKRGANPNLVSGHGTALDAAVEESYTEMPNGQMKPPPKPTPAALAIKELLIKHGGRKADSGEYFSQQEYLQKHPEFKPTRD